MKRFYKKAQVAEVDGGFSIELDGRTVKTPAKQIVKVPSRPLAEALAKEWNQQGESIVIDAMPLNRFANTAIDRVSAHHDMVVKEIAGFAATDLVSHRANYPSELVDAQAQGWDPVLDWFASEIGVRLLVAESVVALNQPADAEEKLHQHLAQYDVFEMAALHTVVNILGSVVLATALFKDHLSPDDAWRLSRLDEDYQARQWGEDAEAVAVAKRRKEALMDADRFFRLYRTIK